jgi:hypothetical protein
MRRWIMESEDKRGSSTPVPDNCLNYLNPDQLITYRRITAFGWHVKFIRRPIFQRPVCVMMDPEQTTLGIIEEDGTLVENPVNLLRSTDNLGIEPVGI